MEIQKIPQSLKCWMIGMIGDSKHGPDGCGHHRMAWIGTSNGAIVTVSIWFQTYGNIAKYSVSNYKEKHEGQKKHLKACSKTGALLRFQTPQPNKQGYPS